MYLPLGFFSQKKNVREASLAPLAHGLHTSSMLGFATNIQMEMLGDACVLNHCYYKPNFYTTFNSFIE